MYALLTSYLELVSFDIKPIIYTVQYYSGLTHINFTNDSLDLTHYSTLRYCTVPHHYFFPSCILGILVTNFPKFPVANSHNASPVIPNNSTFPELWTEKAAAPTNFTMRWNLSMRSRRLPKTFLSARRAARRRIVRTQPPHREARTLTMTAILAGTKK